MSKDPPLKARRLIDAKINQATGVNLKMKSVAIPPSAYNAKTQEWGPLPPPGTQICSVGKIKLIWELVGPYAKGFLLVRRTGIEFPDGTIIYYKNPIQEGINLNNVKVEYLVDNDRRTLQEPVVLTGTVSLLRVISSFEEARTQIPEDKSWETRPFWVVKDQKTVRIWSGIKAAKEGAATPIYIFDQDNKIRIPRPLNGDVIFTKNVLAGLDDKTASPAKTIPSESSINIVPEPLPSNTDTLKESENNKPNSNDEQPFENVKFFAKTDLEVHEKHWTAMPIYHRIQFDGWMGRGASIYLTKSCFHRDENHQNQLEQYRIFPWHSERARAFLQFGLDSVSPSLGAVRLIGRYTPQEDNLVDIQYESQHAKHFVRDARAFLEGTPATEHGHNTKIDISAFGKLKEVVPIASQGRAIYGKGSFIIDGPAGTGKSTTVIQRIRIMMQERRVPPGKVLLLVKNPGAASAFRSLLGEIGADGVAIQPFEEILTRFQNLPNAPDTKSMTELSERAEEIHRIFEEGTMKHKKGTIGEFKFNHDNDSNETKLELLIADIFNVRAKFAEFIMKKGDFRKSIADNRRSYLDRINDIEFKAEECRRKRITAAENDARIAAVEKKLDKEKPEIENKIEAEVRKDPEFKTKTEEANKELKAKLTTERIKQRKAQLLAITKIELDPVKIAKINTETTAIKIEEIDALNRAQNEIKEQERKSESRLEKTYLSLADSFYSQTTLLTFARKENEVEKALLYKYVQRIAGREVELDTVIIDEAQDASLLQIELAYLLGRHVILSGDELQCESSEGIRGWEELSKLKKHFSEEGKLKIFHLSRNFRQTYEIVACSYNFRQRILGRDHADISGEYFENEKGFRKPKLARMNEFASVVKDNLTHIEQDFQNPFPLVIFHDSKSDLAEMKKIIQASGIEIETKISFVSLQEIAGREFPVVVAPLSQNLSSSLIYIILTRAQFSLTLLRKENESLDTHLEELLSQKLIEKYEPTSDLMPI